MTCLLDIKFKKHFGEFLKHENIKLNISNFDILSKLKQKLKKTKTKTRCQTLEAEKCSNFKGNPFHNTTSRGSDSTVQYAESGWCCRKPRDQCAWLFIEQVALRFYVLRF